MGLTVINDGQEQLRKTNFRVKSLMHRDEKADKAVVGKEAKLLVGQRVEYVQPQTVPAKKKRFSRKKVQPEVSEPEVVYSGDPELLLSIRGGVAISIARFSSEGRIILNDSGEIADRELARDMVALLDPERAKHRGYLAAAKSVFTQWVETLTERGPVELANPDDLDAYAVGVIANKSGFGLCPEINTVGHLKARSNQYPVYVSELEADWDIFKSKIKDALPKITQPPLRSFCDAILKGVEQDTKKVLEALGVESLLEAQFGPADSPAEELAAQLGKYASRDVHKFAGVLKDHKAGKTITDVDTEVRFENRPGNIRVNVQGRPSALEGMAPVTLFDTVIYFDRRNDLPEAEVMELADVLGNLVFRRAEEATEEYRKFKQTPASAG